MLSLIRWLLSYCCFLLPAAACCIAAVAHALLPLTCHCFLLAAACCTAASPQPLVCLNRCCLLPAVFSLVVLLCPVCCCIAPVPSLVLPRSRCLNLVSNSQLILSVSLAISVDVSQSFSLSQLTLAVSFSHCLTHAISFPDSYYLTL